MYKCVHCGFCLQACPTYLETGLETESPRGRIALMKAVNEGRIGITPEVYRHWDLCIQCRACEVACPSGVPYGNLIEATMSEVEPRRKKGFLSRAVGNFALNSIIPRQGRLELVASLLRLYQWSGMQTAIVRKTKVLATTCSGSCRAGDVRADGVETAVPGTRTGLPGDKEKLHAKSGHTVRAA